MSHAPHELADEFPGKAETIHALKASNAHFAKLVDDYHVVNRDVHRAETRVQPVDSAREAELRHNRVALKDAIWAILSKA